MFQDIILRRILIRVSSMDNTAAKRIYAYCSIQDSKYVDDFSRNHSHEANLYIMTVRVDKSSVRFFRLIQRKAGSSTYCKHVMKLYLETFYLVL
jgi:hypothetical protein